MAKTLFSVLLFGVFAVTACQGWFFANRCNPFTIDWQSCLPCTGLSTRTVTLRVRNLQTEPKYEESVEVRCARFKTLFNIMTEAADDNASFKFSVTYFAKFGFFIDAINGVAGNTTDKTWWQVLDGNNQQTTVGISSYVPWDGETVTFNFTQGWDDH